MINKEYSIFRISKDNDAMIIEPAIKSAYDRIASIPSRYIIQYKKLLERTIYENLDTSILLQMKEYISNESQKRNAEV